MASLADLDARVEAIEAVLIRQGLMSQPEPEGESESEAEDE